MPPVKNFVVPGLFSYKRYFTPGQNISPGLGLNPLLVVSLPARESARHQGARYVGAEETGNICHETRAQARYRRAGQFVLLMSDY